MLPAEGAGVADVIGASRLLVSEDALGALTDRANGTAAGRRTDVEHTKVIIRPVVSEKSYVLAANDRYTFRVHPDAHKTQIRQAVEALFDVNVVEVRTMSVKSKPKRRGAHVRPHAPVEEGDRPGAARARRSPSSRACRASRAE